MSAPPSTYEPNLSTREEFAVSATALSKAPWKLAGAAGVAATGADFLVHLPFHLFHPQIFTPLAMGAVAFFAVAGAGALIRTRHSRALRWARRRPWRYAVAPGAACAIVVFALMVVHGSGVGGSGFSALLHRALAYGATGVVGTMGPPRPRQPTSSRGPAPSVPP